MKRYASIFTWAMIMALATVALAGGNPARASVTAQSGSVQRNVTYCSAGGVDLKMDIYPPKSGSTKPAPAVIYLHGGGWVSGDKSELGLGAGDLNDHGYLVASVNYRLAPQYKWPSQIEDAKCAVRFLRANAATYGIDTNRIGVWGSSAGGHLAALIGLATKDAGFDTQGGYLGTSSRVQAVVDMFGPTDLLAYKPDQQAAGLGQTVFGYVQGAATGVLVKASPVTYVTREAPPFLILQGEKDTLVPPSQSQELHDKLQAAGAQSSLVMVKNAGHAFVPVTGNLKDIDPGIDAIRAMILDFFDRTLGGIKQEAAQAFPQTGKSVQGKFLSYWQSHGGLAINGYPITDEIQERSFTDGKTYTVQYFERARFELHPENSPPNDVQLSLLGVRVYNKKYAGGSAPGQAPNRSAGSLLFKETGKRLGGQFLEYWNKNGGLPQFGYPISDEFDELSPLDGKVYRVQYFERAEFELHPTSVNSAGAATNWTLLLSQLGTLQYKEREP